MMRFILFLAINLGLLAYNGSKYLLCKEPEPDTLTSFLVWLDLVKVETQCPSLETTLWNVARHIIIKSAVACILVLGRRILKKFCFSLITEFVREHLSNVQFCFSKLMDFLKVFHFVWQFVTTEMIVCVYLSYIGVYIAYRMLPITRGPNSLLKSYISRAVSGLISPVCWTYSKIYSKGRKYWIHFRKTQSDVKYYICWDIYKQSGEMIFVCVTNTHVYIIQYKKETEDFICLLKADSIYT